MKQFLRLIKAGFTRLLSIATSPSFTQYVSFAMSVVTGIQMLAPNKTTEQAIAAYDKFGVPVTRALADGVLSDDEVKAALGFLAGKVLKRRFPEMSTTQANILVNAAYEQIKEVQK